MFGQQIGKRPSGCSRIAGVTNVNRGRSDSIRSGYDRPLLIVARRRLRRRSIAVDSDAVDAIPFFAGIMA
jgi:hypothetical protein